MKGYDDEGPSFPAVCADGKRHTLTPLYRADPAGPGPGRERDRALAHLVALRTGLGRWADRVAAGSYRISDRYPPLDLTSTHPDAV